MDSRSPLTDPSDMTAAAAMDAAAAAAGYDPSSQQSLHPAYISGETYSQGHDTTAAAYGAMGASSAAAAPSFMPYPVGSPVMQQPLSASSPYPSYSAVPRNHHNSYFGSMPPAYAPTVDNAALAYQHASPRPVPSSTIAASKATATALRPGQTGAPKPYQCTECPCSYSRPEHLQRHVSVHSFGKRFVCETCGKPFNRADLLKRHYNVHKDQQKRRTLSTAAGSGTGAGESTSAMFTSSRVSRACQACAKARVKCEEIKPCSRCQSRHIECRNPEPLVVSSPPSAATTAYQQKLDNASPAHYQTNPLFTSDAMTVSPNVAFPMYEPASGMFGMDSQEGLLYPSASSASLASLDGSPMDEMGPGAASTASTPAGSIAYSLYSGDMDSQSSGAHFQAPQVPLSSLGYGGHHDSYHHSLDADRLAAYARQDGDFDMDSASNVLSRVRQYLFTAQPPQA